jgi:hypothetical protein
LSPLGRQISHQELTSPAAVIDHLVYASYCANRRRAERWASLYSDVSAMEEKLQNEQAIEVSGVLAAA